MFGTNADPRHASYIVSPETVQAGGYAGVRSVVAFDHNMRIWAGDCARAGIDLLPVVARETLEDWDAGWGLTDYLAAAEALHLLYGDLFTAIQVGNEPDLQSESSWSLEPEQMNLMLEAFRLAWPGTTIVGPGLADGTNPGYADRLNPALYDVLAIHCYGFMPDGWPLDPYSHWVRYLLQQYEHVPKPIWVTEYGGKRGELRDEATRGAYYRALGRDLLNHPQVERVYAFCLDTAMHPDYGVRDHGNPIPGWDDLPATYYPTGGSVMQTDPVLGNPWGADGALTLQTTDGRQITIEGYDNGIRYTGPDGSTWSLPHVQEDASDPNVIQVAGRFFRAV